MTRAAFWSLLATVRAVATTRLAVVSDTHLSPAAREADGNWDAVVRHVGETRPDLVIHVGDLSLDGAHRTADLDHAIAQLDRLPVAWHAVPGNHDVGDNPWPGLPAGEAIDAQRHERWLEVVGPDYWSLRLDAWTVLAIDAQLFGADLEAADAQWAWIEEELATFGARPIVLVTHKPWLASDTELAAAPSYRFVPAVQRARFDELFGDRRPELVVSGHVHQHRELAAPGSRHLWATTTWAVLPDERQPTLGTKRCGLLSLELHDNGSAIAQLVEPEGLGQFTLGRDIADPYAH